MLLPVGAGPPRGPACAHAPEVGLGHTLGVFVSAVEAHSQLNVRRSIDQSLAELAAFLPTAQLLGVPVAG